MKLYNEQGEFVCEAKRCKEPKFSYHRGRTWDSETKIIDGEVYKWHYDSTWGANFYFAIEEKWYCSPVIRDNNKDGLIYKEKLFTKG